MRRVSIHNLPRYYSKASINVIHEGQHNWIDIGSYSDFIKHFFLLLIEQTPLISNSNQCQVENLTQLGPTKILPAHVKEQKIPRSRWRFYNFSSDFKERRSLPDGLLFTIHNTHRLGFHLLWFVVEIFLLWIKAIVQLNSNNSQFHPLKHHSRETFCHLNENQLLYWDAFEDNISHDTKKAFEQFTQLQMILNQNVWSS